KEPQGELFPVVGDIRAMQGASQYQPPPVEKGDPLGAILMPIYRLNPRQKLRRWDIEESYNWEDKDDLALVSGHLFMLKESPPLDDLQYDPLVNSEDKQLLLLDKLHIEEPDDPHDEGHTVDYIFSSAEVLDVHLRWDRAFPTL